MLKKILFTFMTLLMIYSSSLVGYKLFEPDQIYSHSYSDHQSSSLDYETLKQYTISGGSATIHYYFFYSTNSNDSLYVENSILPSVEKVTPINLEELIEYVDITDLEINMETNRLKADWDISSYPAFVSCQVIDGEIKILNKLEWNSKEPMSEYDVMLWLNENKLYQGAIPDSVEKPK